MRIVEFVSIAIMSTLTFAMTLAGLLHDRVPRWQGWMLMGGVLLMVALLTYLSARRAILDEDLRRIDAEHDAALAADAMREGRVERHVATPPVAPSNG